MVAHIADDWFRGLARTERCAQLAYRKAGLHPGGMEGLGELTERLIGDAAVVEVDHGVPPGRAVLTFRRVYGEEGSRAGLRPATARMLGRQSDTQLMMAHAHALAQYVAWMREEVWDEAMMTAVALAIAMPQPAIGEDLAALSLADVAHVYGVDPILVAQRSRMLRGGSDSGERPAVSAERATDLGSGPQRIGCPPPDSLF